MRNLPLLLLIAFTLATPACIHNRNTVTNNSAPTPPPPASPIPSPPTPAGGLSTPEVGDNSPGDFDGTAEIVEKKRSTMEPALLKEVRTGRHENFDRIVFQFAGPDVPGYHVEYIDKPVRQCGSGAEVPLGGDGFLLVRLQPANAHDENGKSTIVQRELNSNLPVIRESKLICDFEADVQWILGVSRPNRYRVLELLNPARLVVDVKHRSSI